MKLLFSDPGSMRLCMRQSFDWRESGDNQAEHLALQKSVQWQLLHGDLVRNTARSTKILTHSQITLDSIKTSSIHPELVEKVVSLFSAIREKLLADICPMG